MNLIFSQTGHNHGAYFLLFLLPAAVWYTKIFKKPWGISILFAITAAIVTSFSRAALGVATAYGIYILKTAKLPPWTKHIVQSMVFFSLLMGFVMYLLSYTPERIKTRLPLSDAVKAQFYKSTLAEESRFSDWKQAIQGFLTSPLTGTGPGTFWLTSKQFQTTRMSASAFAHSAPLQLLSEQGLLGFLAWGYISIMIGKKLLALRKKTIAEPETSQKTATLALVDGIILSFILSLFLYNLDYLSLSLLIWLSVGLLLGVTSEQKGNHKAYPYLIMLLVIPCLVYALVTLYGTSLWKWASTNEQGAKLLSYQTNRMEIYLEARKFTHQPVSPSVINLILLFHKDNPDTASLLASLSPSPFDFETQNQLFQKSILRNPLNTVNYDAYMKFLLENHRYIGTGEVYQMLIKTTLRVLGKPYPQSLDFRDPHIVTLYTPEFMEIIKSRGSQREILSKSLYILGLRELPTNPSFTKQVWDLASVISPDWSYFAIERASYALYINDSPSEAKGILTACAKRYSPSKECLDVLSRFPNLPEPGSYEKAILYIPGIL